jgi:hypothetical protein
MSLLGREEIESFVERGWCRLERAFTPGQARAARTIVWQRMWEKRGISESDPATWPPVFDIEEHLHHPQVLECFTDRLASAIEQLLGAGRWSGARQWGLWPVNFHYGRDERDPVPQWGWHIDGNWFRHTLDCPKQGLLVIGLFCDVEPEGGGTVVAGGSHHRTARVLAAHPDGLSHRELFEHVLAEPIGDFEELTGAAGDVVLAHPFLFHTRGFKRRGSPRVISNTEAPLVAPMCFQRQAGNYSILEQSILSAFSRAPSRPPDAMRCRF